MTEFEGVFVGVGVLELLVEGFGDGFSIDAFEAELGFDETAACGFGADDGAGGHRGVLGVVQESEFQ